MEQPQGASGWRKARPSLGEMREAVETHSAAVAEQRMTVLKSPRQPQTAPLERRDSAAAQLQMQPHLLERRDSGAREHLKRQVSALSSRLRLTRSSVARTQDVDGGVVSEARQAVDDYGSGIFEDWGNAKPQPKPAEPQEQVYVKLARVLPSGRMVLEVYPDACDKSEHYIVLRTRTQLLQLQDTLRESFADYGYTWPMRKREEDEEVRGASVQALLDVCTLNRPLLESYPFAELLNPKVDPPLGAVRESATKTGWAERRKKAETFGKWAKRFLVLHGARLHLYGTEEEEDLPHSSVLLELCVLDVVSGAEGTEMTIETWAPQESMRLRFEDRREAQAWLTQMRAAKHKRMKKLYFAPLPGKDVASKDPLPQAEENLFVPLSDVDPDLTWKPSIDPALFVADSSTTVLLTQAGKMRAGAPCKLVERILDEKETSHQDVVSFLLTFESFMKPLELLDALCSHFDKPTRGAEGFMMRVDQLRVITVITKWLEVCPFQFHRDRVLLARTMGWIQRTFKEDRPNVYKKFLLSASKQVWIPKGTSPPQRLSPGPSKEDLDSGRTSASSDSGEVDEKEKLRAAVRARMAAHSALQTKGVPSAGASTSSPSSARNGSRNNMSAAQAGSNSSSGGGGPGGPGGGSGSGSGGSGGTSASTSIPTQSSPRKESVPSGPNNLSASQSLGTRASLMSSGNRKMSMDDEAATAAGTASPESLHVSSSSYRQHFTPPPEMALPFGWTIGDHQDFFEASPLEVARQLTILEFSLFSSIPLREFHSRGWLSPAPTEICPNIMRSIACFNRISRTLATLVLSAVSLPRRAAIVAFWIRVLEHARALNNFSSVVAITGGLALASVYRLNATWAVVERDWPREHGILKEAQALANSTSNWASLRQALHNVQPPSVPYLGIYCSDLTFADQGNPSKIDGLVNWDKCKLEASLIRDVHLFQTVPYNLSSCLQLQEAFWNIGNLDDDTMYAMSMHLEPRKRAA